MQPNGNPQHLTQISHTIGICLDKLLSLVPRRFTHREIQINHYPLNDNQKTIVALRIKLIATETKIGDGLKERLKLIEEIDRIDQNPTPISFLEKRAAETKWVKDISQDPSVESILRQIYRFVELAEYTIKEKIKKDQMPKD